MPAMTTIKTLTNFIDNNKSFSAPISLLIKADGGDGDLVEASDIN